MEAFISDPAFVLEVLSVQYRQRYLEFLSILGLGVVLVVAPLEFLWELWGAVVACLLYAVVCIVTISILQRQRVRVTLLSNVFIFCTLLVTLAGIYFETPDAVVDPWILTAPVVSYALCNRHTAAQWTLLTLLCLFAVRQVQVHKIALASTILLALSVVALAIVLHLFSSYIEKIERLIVQLGNTDPLTNTLNRRSLHDVLQSEFRRNLRQQMSMTVAMVDVDHFKSYNDRYGHIVGDKALSDIAQVLNETARRSGDFVFRYGGEEFCVLCSGLDEAQARAFAEQLRGNIEALEIEHRDSPSGAISVSVGYRHEAMLETLTPDVLVEDADKALYRAKANGRNRVESYNPDVVSALAA